MASQIAMPASILPAVFTRPITVLPEAVHQLSLNLAHLPGVGQKTALRYAMFLLTHDPGISHSLGQALQDLHDQVGTCERCGHLAQKHPGEPTLCSICRDNKRDPSLLCVVARVQDLLAIERSGAMRGRYFVLGKLLSPLDGVGPGDLSVDRLRSLVEEGVSEVLVATPPSVDGEATALYIAQELADLPVRVSRIASGVPHGGDLEYADQITLGRAIDGRRGLGNTHETSTR